VTYQPLPFSWNDVDEISFVTFRRQVGHVVSGLSLIFCMISKFAALSTVVLVNRHNFSGFVPVRN